MTYCLGGSCSILLSYRGISCCLIIENPGGLVNAPDRRNAGAPAFTFNRPRLNKRFDNVDLLLKEGEARFVDAHTVQVGEKTYRGRKIFIATGTEPIVPPIPGLEEVRKLTNVNIFQQEEIPESLMILGGGAIGSEMAQAFSRLGSRVTLAHMDVHLLPAGRKPVLSGLDLEKAGVEYGKSGIRVDEKLQTRKKHIYAVGDCNGIFLFSHAAMHQGMIALMNALNPTPIKKFRYHDFQVPWSVFTKPEIAQVGLTEEQAEHKGLSYRVYRSEYEDYGRTIAIQHKLSLFDIVMMQHSFPTISLINKRVAEDWIMEKAEQPLFQKLARFFVKS